MVFLVFSLLPLAGGVFFIRICVNKACPDFSHLTRAGLILALSVLFFAAADTALILFRHDPLFAVPLAFAGDGGSCYFLGPFYHIYKQAAYRLCEEPPFFEYYIAPWFFPLW